MFLVNGQSDYFGLGLQDSSSSNVWNNFLIPVVDSTITKASLSPREETSEYIYFPPIMFLVQSVNSPFDSARYI